MSTRPLRPARPDEADAIAALVVRAFTDYVRGIGKEWPGPYEDMPERIAQDRVKVIDGPAGPIATLVHGTIGDVFTIDILAVDPEHQGKGVSRQLLCAAEELALAAGATEIQLHTVAKYDRLVRLYRQAGFAVSHEGPRPNGDDGHPRAFMRKSLERVIDEG